MPASIAKVRANRRAALPIAAVVLTAWGALAARGASACDVCAVYTATEAAEGRSGFRAGVAEQYTNFGTLQLDSNEVPNPDGQYLRSSNTQLFLGYQFHRRFGLQLNLPVLVKSWRRPVVEGEIQESTRGGIGDIALIGNFLAFDSIGENGLLRLGLLGGLTLPSGGTSFLGEEVEEAEEIAAAERAHLARPNHHPDVASGVHGHDLTFGTGSVNGLIGGEIYGSYDRFFWDSALQYKMTTIGAFEYQFADELTWFGGPGAYLLLTQDYTFSLQCTFSGETKGNDTQAGHILDDTAATNLFVGPNFGFTWGTSLSAEAEVDIPIIENNTSLQIVPDYRVRGALVWRF